MKKLSILIALALLIMAVLPVAAQTPSTNTNAPGTWTSSINIQNVDPTEGVSANVILHFYDASGAEVYKDDVSITGTNAIPHGGSRTIVLSGLGNLKAGQYSVMVESSADLEVIANSTSSLPVTAGAYQGVKDTDLSTVLYFPGLYNNYYQFKSEIVLQNTTTTTANVTIDFYNPATGDPITTAQVKGDVPGNATRIFALPSYANVPSGNANGILAAKVTSTQAIAGVANTWSPTMRGEFSDYNGFKLNADPTTQTVVYAPGLYNNFYGFVSALTVQNIGQFATDIKVTYSNGATESKTLKPNQSVAYYTVDPRLPSGNTNGIFSAKIESIGNGGNPAQPIVGLVNVESKTKGMLGSYNAASAVSSSIGCPVLMKSYYGWYTGTTVQNVGTQTTDVTITYADGKSKKFTGVAANGTVGITELGDLPNGSPLNNTTAISATISSSNGQPLVAVVQEDNTRYPTNPGDYLLVYTCVTK